MGQKTHPKGFRLVTTQKHLSQWYTKKFSYPSLIEEDFLIRTKVEEFFQEFLSISKIEISRIHQETNEKEYVNVTIHALFPRAKEMYKKVTKYFSETSDNAGQKTVSILNNSKGNLEKRVPFRRAVKQAIKKVQLTSLKGIKVQVSGRLNGTDIARSEWKRDGKIPLHTLKATIDYTHQRAETIYGVIGIKVWLFIK